MGLDYTYGCVNFRDIGGYVNLILDSKRLPERKLFRGGSIDYVKDHAEIEHVKSIINLRNRIDSKVFDSDYYHFPMSNKIEKYDTGNSEVQIWINSVIKIFENETLKYPVLIHCLSGKDRTGIIVSSLLLILGVSIDVIEEEYLLSEGEVKLSLIRQAIEGFQDINSYFKGIDIDKVRDNILKTQQNNFPPLHSQT